MKIISKVKTSVKGVEIKPGIGDYDIDHKDPMSEKELFILKFEQKVINFSEILPMEKKVNEEKKEREAYAKERANKRLAKINEKLKVQKAEEDKEAAEKKVNKRVRRAVKSTKGIGRAGSANSGGRGVSDKPKNASAARGPLPKRRDADDKAS